MRRYFISIAGVLALPICSLGQTGVPSFGSFTQNKVDLVNNANGNVVLPVPIVSSQGRGFNLSFSAVYNSQVWAPWMNQYGVVAWTQLAGWLLNSPFGQIGYQVSDITGSCGRQQQGYTDTTTINNYVYMDSMGTLHPFNISVTEVYNSCTDNTTYSGTYSGYATDQSGYYASISNPANSLIPTITSKSGVAMSNNLMTITDTNGNYLSAQYVSGPPNTTTVAWTDTAGRVALKIFTSSTSVQYSFLDPTGAYQTTTFNLSSLSIKTNFGCSNIVEYSGTMNLPTSAVLPNGNSYSFTYEATPGNSGYYTGRVQKVTLPTGGSYEYDYTGSNDGTSCSDGSTLGMNEVVSDGTNNATWKFSRSGGATTITTPQLADTSNAYDTVITFTGAQATQSKVYKESPGVNVLRTANITWGSNNTPSTRVTILEDGTTQSETDVTYDSNGLLDSVSEYDWGSGSHGPLLRTTNYTYQTSTNYTNLNIINLVTSKQIKDGSGTIQYRQDISYDGVTLPSSSCPTGAAQHNDAGFPCGFNYRGNPTAVTTYLTPAAPANGITKNFTYDWFGNRLTAQLNCCQNMTWVYSSTTQYSQPDSVTSGTSPTHLTESATYNAYTSQIATKTDANNLVTSFSYDYLRRVTQVSQKSGSTNGSSISYSYDDTHFKRTTTTTIDSSKSVQQITSLDTLGRPNLTTIEDANNNVISKVSSQYDLAGRLYETSNPYTGTGASYWTTSAFDVLGRPTTVTLQDNSATTYSYSTNTVTVTDPAGKKRKSQSDAAGRLISAFEPDSSNNLSVQTSATYNVLNELTQITEGSQTRSYVYDALGRTLSATTPESGQVCFGSVTNGNCNTDGYDSFNNLLKKTDARGVVTNITYDALNRLSQVSYNVGTTGVTATPTVSYTYGTSASSNNNGRLTAMTDGPGSENYTYNPLGQMTELSKIIGSTTYNTYYSYNLIGEVTQIKYPSNRAVNQTLDPIGRLSSITDASTTYVSGIGYNAAGEVTGFTYGNGVTATIGYYSDRLQMSSLIYANNSGSLVNLTYTYGSYGSNDGLISNIIDNVDSGRNAIFLYDSLGRLAQTYTAGSTNYPAWGLSWAYDRYGNRTAQSISSGCTGITCPTNSLTVSSTTNQITGSGLSYDASGNMTRDGLNTLTYDAVGRLISSSNGITSGSYTNDGNGMRVKRVAGSTTTVYIFAGGKVIAEYDNGAAAGSPSREYIYSGGRIVAKIDSSGTKYYHQDHLSNRLVTDSNGNTVAQMGHFPYGESWYNATNDKLFFTTYERDSESGNDYAQARYHISRFGRFSSPDRNPGSIADPQSLNRYSYVRGMPSIMTDPTGFCPGGVAQAHPSSSSRDSANGGPSESDADDEPPPPSCEGYSDQGFGCSFVIDGGPIISCGDFPDGGGGIMGGSDANCPDPTVQCGTDGTRWTGDDENADPTNPNCNLTIHVNVTTSMDVTMDDIGAAEARMASLIMSAGVDVTIVNSGSKGKRKLTVNFADSGIGGSDDWGNTPLGRGPANVWVDNMDPGQYLDNIMGNVAVHELLHAWGVDDQPFNANNPNDIMSTNDAPLEVSWNVLANNTAVLTQKDKDAILAQCPKKNGGN